MNIVRHLLENQFFFAQSHFSEQWYSSTLFKKIFSTFESLFELVFEYQQECEKTDMTFYFS